MIFSRHHDAGGVNSTSSHRGEAAPRLRLLSLLLLICSSLGQQGCQGFADQGQPVLTALGQSRGAVLTPLETYGIHGLSDLTHSGGGTSPQTFWTIPEQTRTLLQLNLVDPERPCVEAKPRPILGIDEAYDTESVTSLGGGRFAIGTETMQNKRPVDTIFLVSGSNPRDPFRGPLQVVDTLDMPYSLWPGLAPRRNEGLEGLCAAGNVLLAASESVGRLPTGLKYAPLGRYDMESRTWTPYALALTLPTGRLSAVQCRISRQHPGRIELLAIERHFGVCRILHAWVPEAPEGNTCQEPPVIFAEVVADLAAMMAPLINFEGIDWLDDGDLLLVTDNHMGFVRGPTYLLRLPRP